MPSSSTLPHTGRQWINPTMTQSAPLHSKCRVRNRSASCLFIRTVREAEGEEGFLPLALDLLRVQLLKRLVNTDKLHHLSSVTLLKMKSSFTLSEPKPVTVEGKVCQQTSGASKLTMHKLKTESCCHVLQTYGTFIKTRPLFSAWLGLVVMSS